MNLRLTVDEASRALAAAQKPGDRVPAYLRWVNRPLGGRAAVGAAALGLSPNHLTGLSALLGAGGILLLGAGSGAWVGPFAALLLFVGYIFDSADGQLARIQGRGGPAGEWLDHVVDAIRSPLVHVAVAYHVFANGHSAVLSLVAVLFSVLVSAWFLSQILAEKLLPRTPARESFSGKAVLASIVRQPQDVSTTYLCIMTIGLPYAFPALYVGLFAWNLVVFGASLRRKFRQLRQL